jgi:hypothetical protein
LAVVNIPSDLQDEASFFRFRFSGSRKIKYGTLIDIRDCVVRTFSYSQKQYKDHSWNEFKAKYDLHRYNAQYRSTISYCLFCGKQADFVLLYKYIGCKIREKYCLSCAEKKIIKL